MKIEVQNVRRIHLSLEDPDASAEIGHQLISGFIASPG
jgi:hypothetical protein